MVEHSAVRCKSCSYDLRARERGAKCPECGTWVYNSLKREYRPERTDALYRLCVVVSVVTGVFAVVWFIGIPQDLFWELAHPDSKSPSPRWSDRAWVVFCTAIFTAPCWGWVLVRVVDRRFERERRQRAVRGFEVVQGESKG